MTTVAIPGSHLSGLLAQFGRGEELRVAWGISPTAGEAVEGEDLLAQPAVSQWVEVAGASHHVIGAAVAGPVPLAGFVAGQDVAMMVSTPLGVVVDVLTVDEFADAIVRSMVAAESVPGEASAIAGAIGRWENGRAIAAVHRRADGWQWWEAEPELQGRLATASQVSVRMLVAELCAS